MKKLNAIKFLFTLAFIIPILSGCSQRPEIEQLENDIQLLIEGIENRDASEVTDRLSEYFIANDKLDKEGVKRLMLANFLHKKNIEVIVSNLKTIINPSDPRRASASASVVLIGARQFIPDSGRSYQVESEWQIEGSDWRLMTLDWE